MAAKRKRAKIKTTRDLLAKMQAREDKERAERERRLLWAVRLALPHFREVEFDQVEPTIQQALGRALMLNQLGKRVAQ